MLQNWLKDGEPESQGLLEVRMVEAAEDAADDALIQWLGHELQRNYLMPGELEAVFEDLGVPEVAEHLRRNKFPSRVEVRNGDFGEALAAALYRREWRWCVPVLKLRYKQRPDQAVQGADVIAFRLRRDPPVVAVPEVKTRTIRRLDVGIKANTSLEQILARVPENITFVVAMLSSRGVGALASRVALLLKAPYTLERHIVLVNDREQWSEEIITRLRDVTQAATSVAVVRIPGLAAMITDAYAAAAAGPAAATDGLGHGNA